ncbi:uncharacterized protein [Apostichopus japonicus]|uniref:uncharacterized protein isoform X2 n=1 Tax=Stichopus japonicus TaxID=307972 RepID=UPI003AB6239B
MTGNQRSDMSGNIQSLAPKLLTRQTSEEEQEKVVKQGHVSEYSESSIATSTGTESNTFDGAKRESDGVTEGSRDKELYENAHCSNDSESEVNSQAKDVRCEVVSSEPTEGDNKIDGLRGGTSSSREDGQGQHQPDEEEAENADEKSEENQLEETILIKIQSWLVELRGMETFSTERALEILKGIANHHWQHPQFRGSIASAVDGVQGADILLTVLKSLSKEGLFKRNNVWYPANYCYNVVWNLSDESSELAASLGDCGIIGLCATNVAHKPYIDHLEKKNVMFLIKASLSILHNLSKIPANRRQFRENDLVQKLLPFTTTDQKYLKALCMLILANIVDEDQESLLDEKGTIEFLIKLLKEAQESEDRRAQGLSCTELANGLGRLAVNDTNKLKIQSANGLPPFINMLNSEDILEQEAATEALWSLSFDPSICKLLSTNEKALSSLRHLQSCGNKAVELSAKGTMWMLRQVRKSIEDEGSVDSKKRGRPKSSRQSSLRRIHVMISYQWSSQKMVLKIRDVLVAAGYIVWVDVDRMCGSTLQAMAEAVEKAAAVIICMSEGYKMSPNCRTEAEYAYQLQKWIIPLMMDMYYEPDGWLGLILGAKYYMDFSGIVPFEESVQKLTRELDSSKGSFETPDSVFVEETVEPDITKSCELSCQASPPGTVNWRAEDVQSWLMEHNLEKYRDSFQECTGKLLHQMKALRQEAPEFFFRSLKEDLGISNFFDILRFTEALQDIR